MSGSAGYGRGGGYSGGGYSGQTTTVNYGGQAVSVPTSSSSVSAIEQSFRANRSGASTGDGRLEGVSKALKKTLG